MGFGINRFELLVEPRDQYRNGDRVNCLLIIDLFGQLKCKHIFVTAIGELSVNLKKYYDTLYKECYTETTNFMAIPLHFDDIVGTDVLTDGIHRIPFYFYLHNAFPPTHKATFGHITYFVEAIIDKKLFSDYTHKSRTEIKVIAESNICPPVQYNSPVASNREKVIRAFGLKVGAIRLSAHLDKNIFYKGETLDIHFHLDNRTSHSAQLIAQLVQMTAFKILCYYMDSKTGVTTNSPDVCPAVCSRSGIARVSIPYETIPSLDLPELDVKYTIRLLVAVSDDTEYFDDIPIFVK